MPIEPATVVFTLAERPHVLTVSLRAMCVAGRIAGGFAPLFKALANMHPDTMVALAVAGMDVTPEEAARIEVEIYAEGFDGLVAPLMVFAGLCSNGGRPLPLPGQHGIDQARILAAGAAHPRPAQAKAPAGDGAPRSTPYADALAILNDPTKSTIEAIQDSARFLRSALN